MPFDLSWEHWLVVLSAAISICGSGVYVFDTLRGTTKPNRVTFFLWGFSPLVAVAASAHVGADPWTMVRTFIAGFMPLLAFLASFVNPQSYWKLGLFDYACGALALFGLSLWFVADSPVLAILFLAISDGFACLPTLIKAWRFPETETGFAYIASLTTALLVIPSIHIWNIENAAFSVYLVLSNLALVTAIYHKRIVAFLTASPG